MRSEQRKAKIEFITDAACERCAEAKSRMDLILLGSGIEAEVTFYDAGSDRAGELCLDFGIDDVPAIVVNGRLFLGEKFSAEEFLAAARRK